MSLDQLNRDQTRLIFQALNSEIAECERGFRMLTLLGRDSSSTAWRDLTKRLSRLREVQEIVGEGL